MYKIWINTNENGDIIGATGGYAETIVEPPGTYQYSFDVTEDVFKNIGAYHVVDGELVPR